MNPAEPRFLAEVGAGVGWGAGLESSRAGQLSTVPAPASGKKSRFSRGRSPFLEGAQSLAAGPPWRESRRGRSGDSGVRRGQWRCFSRLGQRVAHGDLGPQQAFALSPLPLRIPATALLGKAGAATVLIVLMKMANTAFPSGSAKGEAVGGAVTHCGKE